MPNLKDNFNPDVLENSDMEISMKSFGVTDNNQWIPASDDDSSSEKNVSDERTFIEELEAISAQIQKNEEEEKLRAELQEKLNKEKEARQARIKELEAQKVELEKKRKIAAEKALKEAEEKRKAEIEKKKAQAVAEQAAKAQAKKDKQHQQEIDQLADKAVFDVELAEEQAALDEERRMREAGKFVPSAPVEGHFNVISFHSDYYNRLISILSSQLANYSNARLQEDNVYYNEAVLVCKDLIRVISNSALKYKDVRNEPQVAVTIKDEDLNNLFICLLGETYVDGTVDPDYTADLRSL